MLCLDWNIGVYGHLEMEESDLPAGAAGASSSAVGGLSSRLVLIGRFETADVTAIKKQMYKELLECLAPGYYVKAKIKKWIFG